MKFAIVFSAFVACVASHAVVLSHHGHVGSYAHRAPVHHGHAAVVSNSHGHWDHGHHDDGSWDHARYGDHSSYNHGHWDNHNHGHWDNHGHHAVVVAHHAPTVYAAHHGHHVVQAVAHHGHWDNHGHHGHWDNHGHHAVVHAPVHHASSYTAENRGAVHHAPLAGHVVSQTSLNVAPAPGTW